MPVRRAWCASALPPAWRRSVVPCRVRSVAGAQIVVVEGPDAGKEFELAASGTIGRHEGEIALNDPEVSRRHASLAFDGSAVTVADLGSSNGTFVNDERLAGARQLEPGDKLRVGTTVFEVRLAAEDDATRVRSAPTPASGPPGGAGGPPGGGPIGGAPRPRAPRGARGAGRAGGLAWAHPRRSRPRKARRRRARRRPRPVRRPKERRRP